MGQNDDPIGQEDEDPSRTVDAGKPLYELGSDHTGTKTTSLARSLAQATAEHVIGTRHWNVVVQLDRRCSHLQPGGDAVVWIAHLPRKPGPAA
jgi:hypothetical protein